MKKHIIQLLKQAQKSNKVVSVYTDAISQSACSVGYVDIFNNNEVRLKSISEHGENAGYEIRSLDGVYKISIDGKYEKKLKSLNDDITSVFDEYILSSPKSNTNIIRKTLAEAMENYLIVTVWTSDRSTSIVGLVEYINNEALNVLSIDDFGDVDGNIVIDINLITDVDCNTKREQVLKYLYDKKHGKKK